MNLEYIRDGATLDPDKVCDSNSVVGEHGTGGFRHDLVFLFLPFFFFFCAWIPARGFHPSVLSPQQRHPF